MSLGPRWSAILEMGKTAVHTHTHTHKRVDVKHLLLQSEALCCYSEPYREAGTALTVLCFVCVQHLQTGTANTQMIYVQKHEKNNEPFIFRLSCDLEIRSESPEIGMNCTS